MAPLLDLDGPADLSGFDAATVAAMLTFLLQRTNLIDGGVARLILSNAIQLLEFPAQRSDRTRCVTTADNLRWLLNEDGVAIEALDATERGVLKRAAELLDPVM